MNNGWLQVAEQHRGRSREQRLAAPPLLVFRGYTAVLDSGRTRKKGQVEFCGVGLITNSELVEQPDPVRDRTFKNFRFDIRILPLRGPELDWSWVNDRRDEMLTHNQATISAPWAWRRWIEYGD